MSIQHINVSLYENRNAMIFSFNSSLGINYSEKIEGKFLFNNHYQKEDYYMEFSNYTFLSEAELLDSGVCQEVNSGLNVEPIRFDRSPPFKVLLKSKPKVYYDNCIHLIFVKSDLYRSEEPCNLYLLKNETVTRHFVNLSISIDGFTNCIYEDPDYYNCSETEFQEVIPRHSSIEELNSSSIPSSSKSQEFQWIWYIVIPGGVLILGAVGFIIWKFFIQKNDDNTDPCIQEQGFDNT